jgi:hypothetical protein
MYPLIAAPPEAFRSAKAQGGGASIGAARTADLRCFPRPQHFREWFSKLAAFLALHASPVAMIGGNQRKIIPFNARETAANP